MKVDARKLTARELRECRRRIVRMNARGVPVMEIVRRTGVSWGAVNAALKRQQAGNPQSPARRGRKIGTGRILSAAQESQLYEAVGKKPRDYGLEGQLWSRDKVGRLANKYGLNPSARTLANYLRRWGLAPGCRRPEQRCSREVQRWLRDNLARVREEAEGGRATVCWIERAPLPRLSCQSAEAGLGEPDATVRATRRREWVVFVSRDRGDVFWDIVDGPFTQERQLRLLRRVRREVGRGRQKIYLIRGTAELLAGDKIAEWLKKHAGSMVVLPPRGDVADEPAEESRERAG